MTPDEAITEFMREKPYGALLNMASRLSDRSWSRSMTRDDSKAVSEAVRELREIAEVLYLAREYLRVPEPAQEGEV